MATVINFSGISELIRLNVDRIVADVTQQEVENALVGVQKKITLEVVSRVSKLVCHVVESRDNYSSRPTINIVITEKEEHDSHIPQAN